MSENHTVLTVQIYKPFSRGKLTSADVFEGYQEQGPLLCYPVMGTIPVRNESSHTEAMSYSCRM